MLHSDGSLYFTDPPYGIKPADEALGFYGIYRLSPDGELTLLDRSMVRPNGIGLSPNETQLYVSDSQEQSIQVFDVTSSGELSNGRLFASLKDSENKGVLDGLTVDCQDNIYATGAGGLWMFAPTGNVLQRIALPELTTNVTWGNAEQTQLYVTAGKSLYLVQFNRGQGKSC